MKKHLFFTILLVGIIIEASFIYLFILKKDVNELPNDDEIIINQKLTTIKVMPEDLYKYFRIFGSYRFNLVSNKFDFTNNKMNFPCYFMYYVYVEIEDWNNGHWSLLVERYLACEYNVNVTALNNTIIDSTYMSLPSKLVNGTFQTQNIAIMRFHNHPYKEIKIKVYYSYHIFMQDAFMDWYEAFRNETYLGSFTLDQA